MHEDIIDTKEVPTVDLFEFSLSWNFDNMHEDIIKTKEVPILNLESLNSVSLGTLITCMKK